MKILVCTCCSIHVLRNAISSQERSQQERSQPERSQTERSVDDEFEDLFPETTIAVPVSDEGFRVSLFKAGYSLLKNQFSLMEAQKLNQIIADRTPISLADHLDHMSHALIGKGLTAETELTLKLSLSRILYLVVQPLPYRRNTS